MKALFVCTRPFQLFNYINFVNNDIEGVKGNSDLLLCDFPSLVTLCDNIARSNVFRNIHVFDDGRNGRMNVFLDMVFNTQSLKRDFKQGDVSSLMGYDLIVATSYHPFFVRVANLNNRAKVIMLDDGMGSYLNIQDDRYRTSLFHQTLNFFFHKGIAAINVYNMYLADPKMISHKSDFTVKKLPVISKETYAQMEQIFGKANLSDYANKRIIYLTQPTDLSCMNTEYDESFVQNLLNKNCNETIVRVHPSQRHYKTKLDIDNTQDLWELKCRGLNPSHVLIAPFSTAQFTPHMLYGIDAKLIFLYKMLYKKEELIYSRIEEFLDSFKENYENDIYIPESMSDVEVCIKQCLQE